LNQLYVVILMTLVMMQPAQAEPTVLFDSGNTVPTYPYKQILQGVDIPDFGKLWSTEKASDLTKSKYDPKDPANWLPITTTRLSPGKVMARKVRFDNLASPVCVIGYDPRSLTWIRQYQSVLLKNNVLCWLVSADNLKQVQEVSTALAGVPMSPASGDEIAKFFTITHYPLLITQRFIEQ
jgi:integrating conjugative element protein (TIGR03765 family)